MVQVRIHDMKKVVNVDKVVDVKDKLLALIGRDPSDENLTERVIYFLERLKSFSISLEVLEETSVGKCVYRFRNDSSSRVATLAEEIYQMMKANAQEGTERRIRHKSAGIEDESLPSSSKIAKTRTGAFTSAASAAALAATAAASAASATTGGVDWILQHGGSQQLDVDADIEEWEKASWEKASSSIPTGPSGGGTAPTMRLQSSTSRQAVLPNQYIPPPPPPPSSKSGLTLVQGFATKKTLPKTSTAPIEVEKKSTNAFEKLLRKK